MGTTLQARVAVDGDKDEFIVVKFRGAANTAIETMVNVLLLCARRETRLAVED